MTPREVIEGDEMTSCLMAFSRGDRHQSRDIETQQFAARLASLHGNHRYVQPRRPSRAGCGIDNPRQDCGLRARDCRSEHSRRDPTAPWSRSSATHGFATNLRPSQPLWMGAGMAIRRSILSDVDGFDEMLGPGCTFSACEDNDRVAGSRARSVDLRKCGRNCGT
jgi:hypothetical protein